MPAQAPWDALGGVCEPAAVYRPRHPERTPFYRILEDLKRPGFSGGSIK